MIESWMKLTTLIADDEPRTQTWPRGINDDVAVARRWIESPARPSPTSLRTPIAVNSARVTQLIGERAHRFHFVDATTVDYLEVDGNYVTIHVGEDRFLTRATLKHLSTLLASSDFLRIDRSLLVNLHQVEYVERLEGGQFVFKLRHGQQLRSSRERASRIVKLLRGAVR